MWPQLWAVWPEHRRIRSKPDEKGPDGPLLLARTGRAAYPCGLCHRPIKGPIIVTNRLAIILTLLILVALATDLTLGLGGSRFLARRFLDLVDWGVFWR